MHCHRALATTEPQNRFVVEQLGAANILLDSGRLVSFNLDSDFVLE